MEAGPLKAAKQILAWLVVSLWLGVLCLFVVKFFVLLYLEGTLLPTTGLFVALAAGYWAIRELEKR